MTTYERVTYRPEGACRARTVILRDTTEGDRLLSGVEVDRHGGKAGTLEVSERRHVIDLALVERRTPLTLDRHYGVLRPTKGATA